MLTCSVASRYVGSQPVDGTVRPAVPSMPRLLYVTAKTRAAQTRRGNGRIYNGPTVHDLGRVLVRAPMSGGVGLGGPAQAPGPSLRSVGRWSARLFLRWRPIYRRRRQEHHARPGLRRGGGAEGHASPVSAGADPWQRADPDE